ncbi:hypothetical protein M878_05905 [Streptomyces roseochromogenus subsp. oscitans DS 12.976]|uniref:Uncharacterized protein n=1 Tax=Streptomyces roseochromogenus subsp. oscitans DS 12.976 TaxID=1352936 RepID=V6KVI2_STRRC|nr:hypothetical protein M878_05905 [Streptomyces roseochromogenus subsp. oscitans DS 12.976]
MTAPAAALLGTATALTVGSPARAAGTGRRSGEPGPQTLGDPVFPALG